MRTLTASEVDQVTGGALNLGTGAIGALGGGFIQGGHYALNAHRSGHFSWGTFSAQVVHGTATGFLVGSGATLLHAGVTGALKGATVAGASLMGAGAALGIAPAATSSRGTGDGGGSD